MMPSKWNQSYLQEQPFLYPVICLIKEMPVASSSGAWMCFCQPFSGVMWCRCHKKTHSPAIFLTGKIAWRSSRTNHVSSWWLNPPDKHRIFPSPFPYTYKLIACVAHLTCPHYFILLFLNCLDPHITFCYLSNIQSFQGTISIILDPWGGIAKEQCNRRLFRPRRQKFESECHPAKLKK